MSIRILTPTMHGIVDYTAAAGLITLPFLLGLGESHPMALWASVATGFAVVAVSLATDYRFGAFRVLPFRGHLIIDFLVAVAFLGLPSLFGFKGLDAAFYWVNAAAVILIVACSRTAEPGRQTAG